MPTRPTYLRNMEDEKIVWKDGEPKSQGWYDCLIDGEYEDRLQWWICIMNPKKRHWKDRDGHYVDLSHRVQYTGDPSARFL